MGGLSVIVLMNIFLKQDKEYQSYNISYSHLTSEDAQPIDGFSFDRSTESRPWQT